MKPGPGVTLFGIGEHVFRLGNPHALKPYMSCFQEYAFMDVENLAKIPVSFTFDDAVTFPVNTIISFAALFHNKGFGFRVPAAMAKVNKTARKFGRNWTYHYNSVCCECFNTSKVLRYPPCRSPSTSRTCFRESQGGCWY